MLKIAVVEDQQEVRDELCRFIRQYAAENSLQVEVLPIEDGAVIAEHYEPGYDIIFMDVEMPGLDGFGAAEKIRAVDADAVLVFVTNMAQYAIKGYEVDALDYVLKPVNYYQFCTKLSRAVQRVQRRRGGQVVLQLAGGGMQVLSTGDIYYLETHDRLLWYHTTKGEFSVRASLVSGLGGQQAPYGAVERTLFVYLNAGVYHHAQQNEKRDIERQQRELQLVEAGALGRGVEHIGQPQQRQQHPQRPQAGVRPVLERDAERHRSSPPQQCPEDVL